MDISDHEFAALRRYIQEACGIHIPPDKRYLVQQRLEELVYETGCASFTDLHERLTGAQSRDLREQLVAAISTNETSFFRDGHPFQAFQDRLLPWLDERIKQRRRELPEGRVQPLARIWCAGASTGQEPYSLAMLVHDYSRAHRYLGIRREDFAILATDISDRAIAKARSGRYHQMEVSRGLPEDARQKYFTFQDRHWLLCQEIRSMVHFQKMNLMEPSSLLTAFDLILCRNVLIYFDDDTKRRVIEQFHRKLLPDGYLMLGSAENLYCLSDRFESETVGGAILYRKIA